MVYFAVALFFFIIASFTDVKYHEVSPKITYSLLILGILFHSIESIFSKSFEPLFWSVSMAFACFAFSFILYKAGVWAGGDVKLFTALGAILPSYKAIQFFPFIALGASLIAVFPFIMLYVLIHLVRVPGFYEKTKEIFAVGFKRSLITPFVLTAALFTANSINFVYAVFVIAPVIYYLKKYGLILSLILTVIAVLENNSYTSNFIFVFALSLFLFLFIASYSSAKKYVLRERKKTSELKEGDILAKDLVKKGRRHFFREFSLKHINSKDVVLNSLNAGGLEKKDIVKIKKLGIKTVELKKSIPFIPVFTIGLILVFLLEMLLY